MPKSLKNDRRFQQLAKMLQGNQALAFGLLGLLWDAVYRDRAVTDGTLRGWSMHDIATAAGWSGESSKFISHLTDCEFLDASNPDAFRVVDYADRAPESIKRQLRRTRNRASTAETNEAKGDLSGHCPDIVRTCPDTLSGQNKATPVINKVEPLLSGQCPDKVSGQMGSDSQSGPVDETAEDNISLTSIILLLIDNSILTKTQESTLEYKVDSCGRKTKNQATLFEDGPNPESDTAINKAGKRAKSTRKKAPRKPREPDAIWDAVVEVFGFAPVADSQRSHIGKFVAFLKEKGARPEDVGARHAAYRKEYPDAANTMPALMNQWDYCSPANIKGRNKPPVNAWLENKRAKQ